MDHPFRACFCDADTSDLTNYAERSYFAGGPRAWRFPGAGATMHSYDRPTGAWIDLLRETGLHLSAAAGAARAPGDSGRRLSRRRSAGRPAQHTPHFDSCRRQDTSRTVSGRTWRAQSAMDKTIATLPIAAPILNVEIDNYRTRTYTLDARLDAYPGQFVMLWLPGFDEKPFSLVGSDPVRLMITEVGPFTQLIHAKAARRSTVGARTVRSRLLAEKGCAATSCSLAADMAWRRYCGWPSAWETASVTRHRHHRRTHCSRAPLRRPVPCAGGRSHIHGVPRARRHGRRLGRTAGSRD